MTETKRFALTAELIDILARYKDLVCAPTAEEDDGLIVLTVRFHPANEGQALRALELLGELRYLSGLAQVRAFASEYGIDAEKLEALLPGRRSARTAAERWEGERAGYAKGAVQDGRVVGNDPRD